MGCQRWFTADVERLCSLSLSIGFSAACAELHMHRGTAAGLLRKHKKPCPTALDRAREKAAASPRASQPVVQVGAASGQSGAAVGASCLDAPKPARAKPDCGMCCRSDCAQCYPPRRAEAAPISAVVGAPGAISITSQADMDRAFGKGWGTYTEPQRTGVVAVATPAVADRLHIDPMPEPRRIDAPVSKLLILPDIHCKFEDKRAVALACHVGKTRGTDVLIQMGDLIDCASVSSYLRDPSDKMTLQDEIEATNVLLDQLDAIGAKRKIITFGNHSARIAKYIAEKAPALFGYCKLEELLRLKERGWEWCNYGDYIRVGKICYTHDMGQAGAYAHERAAVAMGRSCVIGHTHRMAMSFSRTEAGSSHVGAMFGYLGSMDQAVVKYMHRGHMRRWMAGFGTGVMQEDGVTFLHPRPIINYRVEVDGIVYQG